jgi:hypothetical protein
MLTDKEWTSQHALGEDLQRVHTAQNSSTASCSDSCSGDSSITAAATDATGSATADTGNHSASINSVIAPMAR